MDLPITVAFFVYHYANLKMLSFVYDFLKHYLRPGSFQMVCSDTDSILSAYESKNLDDLVRPEVKDDYFNFGKKAFLATDAYTNRTPGLFKEDWSGIGILALCSKTYYTWRDKASKLSSKGLSKKTNKFTQADYKAVLDTMQKGVGTNYGFKIGSEGIRLYKQEREGLAYLYGKRRVLADRVTTKALYR